MGRNEAWLGIALATGSAGLLSIYAGLYTDSAHQPGAPRFNNVPATFERLGAENLLLIFAGLMLIAQVCLVAVRSALEKHVAINEGEVLSFHILEAAVRLLSMNRANTIYRALVTVSDPTGQTRRTVCGVNIRTDPEFAAAIPVDFGVAGRALISRMPYAEDVDDSTRNKAQDGTFVEGIWPSVRSVLAFPLLDSDGRAFGTINFDSDKPLQYSRLNDRRIQDILSGTVVLVTYLMRGYSRDGNVHAPR
jgi:hypothetical protein